MPYDPRAAERTRGAHQRNFAPPSPPYPLFGELEPLSDELALRQLRRTPRLLDEPKEAIRPPTPPTAEPEIQGRGFQTLNGGTDWRPIAWFNHPGYVTAIDVEYRPFGLVDGYVRVRIIAVPRPRPTDADADPASQAGAYDLVDNPLDDPGGLWERGSTQNSQSNVTLHPSRHLPDNETALYSRHISNNAAGGIRLSFVTHFARSLAPVYNYPIISFPNLLGRSLRTQPFPRPRFGGLPRGVTINVLQAGRPVATRDLPLANLAPEIARLVNEAAFTGKWPPTIRPIW